MVLNIAFRLLHYRDDASTSVLVLKSALSTFYKCLQCFQALNLIKEQMLVLVLQHFAFIVLTSTFLSIKHFFELNDHVIHVHRHKQ